MSQFTVDESLCTRCGLCVKDCVPHVIEINAKGVPSVSKEKESDCFGCEHCLAVCPSGAVSVLGKNPADSRSVSAGDFPTFAQMDHLVRSRRSIRHYKGENVDPELIDRLLESLAYAPTGVNAQELTFHVIDNKDVMKKFSEKVVTALQEAAAKDTTGHPFLARVGEFSREAIEYMIFRSAPNALVVSAPTTAPCAQEDVALALAYFELLAQSAGLGTVWWGFLRLTSTIIPEAKTILGIPEDHTFYAMLFGYPKIKFARTTQRETAAQTRRVEL